MSKDILRIFGQNIRSVRLKKQWSQGQLADTCNLHRTYISGIERGERNVSLLNIDRIASALEVKISELFNEGEETLILTISGIAVEIEGFTQDDYEEIQTVLENCLALPLRTCKNRDVIKTAFAKAVELAPDANPSDLWHHIVYRLYIEKVASFRPLKDPGQSWKRASGESFEVFLQGYYNDLLSKTDIRLIALLQKKSRIKALQMLGIYGQVGDSKLDIAVLDQCPKGLPPSLDCGHIIGGIHAKVSLAERVSDDEPASRAMIEKGHTSILATLDVKSFPLSETMSEERAYINKGELGTPTNPTDKRKYIEEHGSFDACFSFNLRTVPSPEITASGKKIYVGKFDSKWDALCEMLVEASKDRS